MMVLFLTVTDWSIQVIKLCRKPHQLILKISQNYFSILNPDRMKSIHSLPWNPANVSSKTPGKKLKLIFWKSLIVTLINLKFEMDSPKEPPISATNHIRPVIYHFRTRN